MFIAVDIGNTNVVLGAYEGEELLHVWRISSDASRTEDEYRATLLALFAESRLEERGAQGCMIASVIPRLSHTLGAALERLLGCKAMHLTPDLEMGILNMYEPPGDVGADRLANAAGGAQRYGAPLIIVDFGTATTLDVVSAERHYLGGVIMPGLEMSADALFQKTSLLPRIAIERPRRAIGRSTRESILSGLVWGSIAGADRLVEEAREELGAGADCEVVATGGYAPAMAALSRQITRVDTDLTLWGLLKIWQWNRA